MPTRESINRTIATSRRHNRKAATVETGTQERTETQEGGGLDVRAVRRSGSCSSCAM